MSLSSTTCWCASLVLVLLANPSTYADERPNILWITSEDNASHWLGCYGNPVAHTPRLDKFASEGVLFRHAYSNAPVCSVARNTLLNGVYAVTLGTQHMSSLHPIPSKFKPYVSYLRELGYYCTNNQKTDYNQRGDDRAIWDACSNKAHYKHRKDGQPFFAVFNLNVSHESSLITSYVANNRKLGIIPAKPRLDPATINPPPYLPNLDQVREDIAIYHDVVTALDHQVGNLLDELESAGMAENTIVFYYSDHGGPTPRGKRYLTNTGVQIPLLVRFPKRWQHLSPFPAGKEVDELVSFVDFAPCILSLVGLKKPRQMQGRAFLGKHREAPKKNPAVFLYADRFDEVVGMRRGLTDGRYKYIRRFTPHLPAAPYSYSSLWVPSWLQWQTAWRRNLLHGYHKTIWESPQPVEELYDTAADPWEMNNLAENPHHSKLLNSLRQRLRDTMIATNDTGLIPEAMYAELASGQSIYDYVLSLQDEMAQIVDYALLTTSADQSSLAQLSAGLGDSDPLVRYWSVQGCQILGIDAISVADQLKTLLVDQHSAIRISAAYALDKLGQHELARETLLAELDADISDPAKILLNHIITLSNNLDAVPQSWIRQTLNSKNVNEYVNRFANRLQDIRDNRTKNIRW